MANYGEISITVITEKQALPKLNYLNLLNKVSALIPGDLITEFRNKACLNYLILLHINFGDYGLPIGRDNIFAVIRYGRRFIPYLPMERFQNFINLVNEKKLAPVLSPPGQKSVPGN